MDEKNVDPRIFAWTVKVGTAIITFMAGILVYMHRKIHDMDKAFSVNEQKDIRRDEVLSSVRTTVINVESKLNTAIEMFHEQQTNHNETEVQRKELADLVVSQKSIIKDLQKVIRMN